MLFRHTLSRRDAFLVLIGASAMHGWSLISQHAVPDQSIVIDTQYHNIVHQALTTVTTPPEPARQNDPTTITATSAITETCTQLKTSTIVLDASPTPYVARHNRQIEI